MSTPIILAGASGAGKTFLLEQLSVIDSRLEVIVKKTTRSPRPYEDNVRLRTLDLFNQDAISDSISRGKYPVVIIRDCETIYQIKQDYPTSVVIYIQSGLSGNDLKLKLQQQNRDDIEIKDRMERLQKDFDEYVKYIYLFDHVVINYYDPESLVNQTRSVLRSALDSERIDENFVFVLMSFSPELDDVYEALRTSARLVPNRQVTLQRIDSQMGDYKITDEILYRIRTAGLVIADLTFERPNVYYELGYARGIGKTVLHCAKQGTVLHFDIKDFKTIFYASAIELQQKMFGELQYFYGSKQV